MLLPLAAVSLAPCDCESLSLRVAGKMLTSAPMSTMQETAPRITISGIEKERWGMAGRRRYRWPAWEFS